VDPEIIKSTISSYNRKVAGVKVNDLFGVELYHFTRVTQCPEDEVVDRKIALLSLQMLALSIDNRSVNHYNNI